jgi:predicted ATPase
MPSFDMEGPYTLSEESVDAHVLEKIVGNYALGNAIKGQFRVEYFGRSDTDLRESIKNHVGESYQNFMFSRAEDAVQAYQRDCDNYHDYADRGYRLDNLNHPAKPQRPPSWLKCPRCKI